MEWKGRGRVAVKLHPEEISAVIKERIRQYEETPEIRCMGRVVQTADGIARIYGLRECMLGELLEFSGGVYGMALNLEEDTVAAVLLGDQRQVNEGDKVKGTGHSVDVPVGDGLLGRVVNALGQPVDEKGPLQAGRRRPVEREAHGVMDRKSVNTPLQTGIKAIDAMVPIGRGQRELIIGDRQTGENGHCAGYHPASEGTGSKVHLRGNRSESFHRGSTRSDTGGFRGDGIYGGGGCRCRGTGSSSVSGALCRMCHGGGVDGTGQRRADRLR